MKFGTVKGEIPLMAMTATISLAISIFGILIATETATALGGQSAKTADSQRLTDLADDVRSKCEAVTRKTPDGSAITTEFGMTRAEEVSYGEKGEGEDLEKYLQITFSGDGGGSRSATLLSRCSYSFVEESGGSLPTGIHNLEISGEPDEDLVFISVADGEEE
jgi:hypothetical protein